jgi:hypothetical protein
MPSNVFRLEIAATFAGVRGWMMRLGFTMLIALPFLLVAMPPGVRASGLTMLILFTGFFGAAVALVRRRSDGQLRLLHLLPGPRIFSYADMILAGAAVDVVQVILVVLLYLAVNAPGFAPIDALRGFGFLVAALVPLNLLGLLLGLAMKGNAEVHLTGALSVGVLAIGSGLAPVPRRLEGPVEVLSAVNPISLFREYLLSAADPVSSAAFSAPGTAASLALAAAFATAVLWRGVDWERLRQRFSRESSK